MKKLLVFTQKWKYEILLIALMAHLYNGVLFDHHDFFLRIMWPINMLILGVASLGIYSSASQFKVNLRAILFLTVLVIPLMMPFVSDRALTWNIITTCYALFFCLIFIEVIKFLIRPNYINVDLITAAACGYFLIIEAGLYLSIFILTNIPDSYNGVGIDSRAHSFLDLVYFNTITLTSIGYGDISPNSYPAKIAASFIGVVGQFYSIVLVGIIIGKYTNNLNNKSSKN